MHTARSQPEVRASQLSDVRRVRIRQRWQQCVESHAEREHGAFEHFIVAQCADELEAVDGCDCEERVANRDRAHFAAPGDHICRRAQRIGEYIVVEQKHPAQYIRVRERKLRMQRVNREGCGPHVDRAIELRVTICAREYRLRASGRHQIDQLRRCAEAQLNS